MENSLLNKVKDIKLVTKQSKAGNTYQMLQIMFTNGYALVTLSRTSALGRG